MSQCTPLQLRNQKYWSKSSSIFKVLPTSFWTSCQRRWLDWSLSHTQRRNGFYEHVLSPQKSILRAECRLQQRKSKNSSIILTGRVFEARVCNLLFGLQVGNASLGHSPYQHLSFLNWWLNLLTFKSELTGSTAVLSPILKEFVHWWGLCLAPS